MFQNKKLVAACVVALAGLIQSASAAESIAMDSPVGYWRILDNATGQPKSIVQISKTSDDLLMGKVIKVFPRAGHIQTTLCTACQGDKRNQPIVGMEIISGIKAARIGWDQGKMLDTENGKTYSCSMRLSDSGKKLNVHGYFGLPVFGNTETWERVDLMSGLSSRGYFYD